jgi:hypothetical protein
MDLRSNKDIAIASFQLIETGDRQQARKIIGDDFINLEAADDPEQPLEILRVPRASSPPARGFAAPLRIFDSKILRLSRSMKP